MGTRALLCGAAAVAALLAAACGPSEPPPLTIRMVMYEMDHYRRAIEPHLRNPEQLPELARAARKILEYTDYPTFVGYPDTPAFQSNATLFQNYREQLRGATERFVAAADAGDLNALHGAFQGMTMTCTVCHKRFDPTY